MDALIILSSLAGFVVGAGTLASINWLVRCCESMQRLKELPTEGDEFAPFSNRKFKGVTVWNITNSQWIGSGLMTEQQNILTGAVVWVFYPAKGEEVKRPIVVDIRK